MFKCPVVELNLYLSGAFSVLKLFFVVLILKLYLQGSYWPLGFLMNHCSMLRNRMLADPSFLFKVGTEVH